MRVMIGVRRLSLRYMTCMRGQKPWHATNVCDEGRGCFGCFLFVCLFVSQSFALGGTINTSLLQRVCTCRQGTWKVVCSWHSTCD